MNLLFVTDKPIFRSSNQHLGRLKRKYGIKKMGFSGTLDPFATGCLIVAAGQYTKLFQYLDKTPKTYRATLWLGAESTSLDIENIRSIRNVVPVSTKRILHALSSLEGEREYLPPKYSAKKIGGKRAYAIMREGGDAALPTVRSSVYELKLLHYRHPFISFEATVSEGTYIRSLGAMIAQALEVPGTLSSLRRIREGAFGIEGERPLDPLQYLTPPPNDYLGDPKDLELGRKLRIEAFSQQREGLYLLESAKHFSIVELRDHQVRYRLNRIEKVAEHAL